MTMGMGLGKGRDMCGFTTFFPKLGLMGTCSDNGHENGIYDFGVLA